MLVRAHELRGPNILDGDRYCRRHRRGWGRTSTRAQAHGRPRRLCPPTAVALRRDVGVDVTIERRRPGEYARNPRTERGCGAGQVHGKPSTIVRAASVQVLARRATPEDVEAVLRAAAKGEHRTLASATSGTALGYLAGGLGTAAIVVGAAVRSAFGRRRREAER